MIVYLSDLMSVIFLHLDVTKNFVDTCPAQLTKISQSIIPLSVITLDTALFFRLNALYCNTFKNFRTCKNTEMYFNTVTPRVSRRDNYCLKTGWYKLTILGFLDLRDSF